jgi:Fe-S cluster biogenesis protein NfuA
MSDDLKAIGERIEGLLADIGGIDARAGALAEEVVAVVTDLHGAGLTRVIELALEPGDAPLVDQLVGDKLVAGLLMVHGLHPVSVAERVANALDEARPVLLAHGGDMELLGVDEATGQVRLRLLGSCDGCPSSAATLQGAVEAAVIEAAPEITAILVEGLAAPPAPPPPRSMPVTLIDKPAAVARAALR